MLALSEPEVFWILLTNLLLGVATLALIAYVALTLMKETFRRRRRRDSTPVRDGKLNLRRLGITLPDGGEPIDEISELKKARQGRPPDEKEGHL